MSSVAAVRSEDDEAAERFEGQPAAEVLAWAAERFPGCVVFTTGFGAEGCVLIDLIARARLGIEVVTLDTGLLFPETYALWRRLEERYAIAIRGVWPKLSVSEQAQLHGARLWERAPDRCCALRKVEPLEGALEGYDAWVSGIRRDQTPERAAARVVELDARRPGRLKINPLAAWTSADVWAHVRSHAVPTNVLHDHGYPSIGCWPCTSPVAAGEDPRAGRWRGLEGIRLLAETEGLFAETAGGTVVAAARRLAEGGAFADGAPVVLLITGHGLKTVEHLAGRRAFATIIEGKLADFEAFWDARARAAVA